MDQPSGWFLRLFEEKLLRADVLVHCGDVTGHATWQLLMAHPRPLVAKGNCDWNPALAAELEDFVRLDLPEVPLRPGRPLSIAACHGWGPRSTVPNRVAEHFLAAEEVPDLVCFGHTHQRYFSNEHGVQLVNPGSLGESGSWALVTVISGEPLNCEFRTVSF